jgi:putative serine protease PepD
VSEEDVHVTQQYGQQPYYTTPAPPPQGSPHHRGWSGGAIVAAAIAGAVIGAIIMAGAALLLFGLPALTGQQQQPSQQQQQQQNPPVSQAPLSINTSQPIEAVAARVTPSVVNVGIEQAVTDPFTGATRTQVVGNGSGVIIRSDGYILTNNHVVSGASRVLVTLGLQNLPAKVVGTDPASDIAVIKIDKTGLTPALIGDSDTLKVGETVVAVGSPFGLDKTVTSGIVSALHRTGQAASDQTNQTTPYGNLIQTDAPINPGNSGGALTDLSAQVIGINTLIQTGGAQQSAGIGFAIPIKLAKQVADQLISTGHATHTFLGVASVDVTPGNASQIGAPAGTSGALVQDVPAGSPAEKAGIKRGDVIVKIGDQDVQNSLDLVAAVRSHNPGDKVQVVLLRGSRRITVTATLGSAQ